MSLALGCGRIGFELCASGCGSNGGPRLDSGNSSDAASGIQRTVVTSPGSTTALSFSFPFTQTAGNLALVASYGTSDPGTVTDVFGETWNTLPAELRPCGSPVAVRFFYTLATHSGDEMITVTSGTNGTRGAFAIGYSGTASAPLDDSTGVAGTANTTTLAAGTLTATAADQIVAVFVTAGPLTISPAAGYRRLAQDDAFAAVIEDLPVAPGMYSPTAISSQASSCWVGASVALLPR